LIARSSVKASKADNILDIINGSLNVAYVLLKLVTLFDIDATARQQAVGYTMAGVVFAAFSINIAFVLFSMVLMIKELISKLRNRNQTRNQTRNQIRSKSVQEKVASFHKNPDGQTIELQPSPQVSPQQETPQIAAAKNKSILHSLSKTPAILLGSKPSSKMTGATLASKRFGRGNEKIASGLAARHKQTGITSPNKPSK
jgi:uncharacterized membrane protein